MLTKFLTLSVAYFFNAVFDKVADYGRNLALSDTYHSTDGLILDGRISLRLENVESSGDCDIETVTVSLRCFGSHGVSGESP